ncbi:MAG: hypothetical protein QOF76_5495 [Solirubrobacteraceae bacterium]|nr:hypothetical protein [Solirubrobacteraceae bacterium]
MVSAQPVAPCFPFVQFELTQGLGPAPGRYLVRSGAEAAGGGPRAEPSFGSDDILTIQIHGAAAARRGLLRRGGRTVTEGPSPREVSITVATFIRGTLCMPDGESAQRWLASMKAVEQQEAWTADGLRVVNQAVSAYRACAADPHVADVSRDDPRAVRIGFGSADEVYRGRWTQAVGVLLPAAPKLPRQVMLMPTQAVTAVLSGQSRTLEAEDLLLRVRVDVDQRRRRAAAVGLRAAVELLLAELAGEQLSEKAQRLLDVVIAAQPEVRALAEQARSAPLPVTDGVRLAAIADQAGALVDRWRYEPLGF